MPSRRQTAYSPERLHRSLRSPGNGPFAERGIKQAIGRYMLDGQPMDFVRTLTELNNELLSVYPTPQPQLAYVHSDKLNHIRENGITSTDPRLGLGRDNPFSTLIREPSTLFQAICASPRLDPESYRIPQSADLLNIRISRLFDTVSRNRFEIEFIVGDNPNDFYKEVGNGFTFRGEKAVLCPIDRSDFLQAPLAEDGLPRHRVKVAEADIQAPQNEIKIMLYKHMAKQLVGQEVEFGPLELGPET